MKRLGLLVVAALMLAAFSGNHAYAQGPANQITVALMEQNGSGQSGTATITEQNGTLMVSVNLSNGSSTPQPAHIHKGTCANLDPVPAVPLTNVVNGKSDTTIGSDAVVHSIADLSAGSYAINIHKSAAEAKVYVACGDIHAMMTGGAAGGTGATGTGTTSAGPANQTTVQLNEQNGSGQSGTATITEQNGTLMVSINLSNGTDTPQPAHIHKGSCANLDPTPLVPLTNVVNGKSDTTVAADAPVHSIADLANGSYAINIHKSAAEVKVYVACGDIHAMMTGGAAGGTGTTATATPVTTTTGAGGDTGAYGGGTTTGTAPGMPSTGTPTDGFMIFAVVLAALALVGTGVKVRFAHRKIR